MCFTFTHDASLNYQLFKFVLWATIGCGVCNYIKHIFGFTDIGIGIFKYLLYQLVPFMFTHLIAVVSS
jgi:hypothetical protein